MIRLAVTASVACIAVLMWSDRSPAQESARFNSTAREVMVSFSLPGASDTVLSELGKEDFAVTEDGEARPIRYFARNQDAPLRLAVVLDLSGSQLGAVKANQQRIAQFMERTIRAGDSAFLVTIERKVRLVLDDDRPLSEWNEVLSNTRKYAEGRPVWVSRFGGSPIHDALYACLDHKFQGHAGRKAIVLFSDGEDNASRVGASTLIEKLQSADVVVFGLESPSTAGKVIRYFPTNLVLRPALIHNKMREIAEQTGGAFYPAAKIEEHLSDIEERLRTMFIVSFAPGSAQPDNRFHSIGITVKRPGLRPIHRPGYRYAE